MEKGKIRSFKVLIIGGSAGSLDVILYVLPLIKANPDTAIIIVLHRKMMAESPLASLLASKTRIPVSEAEEKQEILPHHIYLAPADYHLLIEQDKTFSLDYSEKINFSRPSIDATFETAAEAFGDCLTGILLSGANADGVDGLRMIKKYGGVTIAQDPATAEVPFMPGQAVRQNVADHILTPLQIAEYISGL